MLELYASPDDLVPLFEAVLDPPEEIEHKGFSAQASLRTVRGRTNRVQIGASDPISVLDSWPAGKQLADEIAAQRDSFDFCSLRLGCSFVPDRGCRFTWLRVSAELRTAGVESEGAQSVAFDLFPRDVLEKRTYKRSYNVTPSAKFAFLELSAGRSSEEEHIRYEPRLTAAGLLTDLPTWTFDALDRSGLVGSSELFLLAKKPKGQKLEARFKVAAEVATLLGRVPLRRYRDPELLDKLFPLA